MHTTGIRNLRRLRQRRVVAFVLAAAVAAAPVAALELAELLAAPFPSDLVASPAGDRIAWVFNRTGTRSIWTAASPEWEGEELVAGGGDDGQEIGDLAWSADGASLAFVRGGAPNAAGELPNPLSVATGVTRAVFVVDLESGEERRVDDGSSPLFRGDGALLYLKDGDLWVADGDGGAGERLLSVRGRLGQLELSPDDSLVAFVSDRGTHSFVGVYDFAAGNVEWVDPGLDRDAYPSWSPGGARLAFVRQAPRLDAILFEPQRETDLPWSIRVATLGSDGSWAGTEAWRADAGPGSVYRPVVGNRQLFWLGDDNIAFPWEKTGWNHLWRLSFSSGEAVPQAQGEAEVEYAFQEEPGGEVLFSSNALDVHRRHIWRLKGAAAGVSHLTRGQGIEQAAVPLAGEDFAFLASDARRPLHVQISVGGERREVVPSAIAGFPVTELVEPRIVTITAEDGLEVPAQLFEPKGASTAPRPALLYLHGGSRRQMLPAWHYSAYYHNCYALHQFMVSKGYVVLSLNYRSGIGYGLDFREAEAFGATGASELRDVLAAGRYLASYPDVDPERVGIWGGSYGGYLTALGLARASDLFAAGVDIHGVHDWNRAIRNFIPTYDPLAEPEVAELAFASSPLSSVDTWKSPVLLIHGDDDRNVPFAESVELAFELRRRGVEVETLVFPDEVHGFLTHARWLQAFRRSVEFLDRHLVHAKADATAAAANAD